MNSSDREDAAALEYVSRPRPGPLFVVGELTLAVASILLRSILQSATDDMEAVGMETRSNPDPLCNLYTAPRQIGSIVHIRNRFYGGDGAEISDRENIKARRTET